MGETACLSFRSVHALRSARRAAENSVEVRRHTLGAELARVDERRGVVFVPEERLYLLYRHAVSEHIARIGMTQIVRSDSRVPREAIDVALDEPRDVLAGELVRFAVVPDIVE